MSNPLREYLKKLRKEASGSAGQARGAEDLYYNLEGGYGTTGGALDAFRHSYATGANVMDYGLRGLIAPMAYEFEALVDPKKRAAYAKDLKAGKRVSSILRESFQDLYNNLYGAYIGATSDNKEELYRRISEAVKDGKVLFNTEDYIEENIAPFKNKKYGGNMEKINIYKKGHGGKSIDVDYEAEGGEVVVGDIVVNKKYNGGSAKQYKGAKMFRLDGPKHKDGGIGVKQLGEVSYVFSDKLDAGGMTYADAAQAFGKELDEINTMAMGGDKYDMNTANRMTPRIEEDIKMLFDDQEQFKKENNIDQNPMRELENGGPELDFNFLRNILPFGAGMFGFNLPGGPASSMSSVEGSSTLDPTSLFGLRGITTPEGPSGPGGGFLKSLFGGGAGAGAGAATAASSMNPYLKAAQFIPTAINLGSAIFGKPQTMQAEEIDFIPEQEATDFSPIMDSYLGSQNLNLATLRNLVEQTGGSTGEVMANIQTGVTNSQAANQNFFDQLRRARMADEQQTRQTNLGIMSQNRQIEQQNIQNRLAAEQFNIASDPLNRLLPSITQGLQTATGIARDEQRFNFLRNIFS